MGFEGGFAGGFVWRMALFVAALGLFAWSLVVPGLAAARLVAGLLAATAAWGLWHHVGRTNREVARFVEALRHGDFAQGFTRSGSAAGFDRLSAALDGAVRDLRQQRVAADADARVQTALADEAPAALLLLGTDGHVALANKAARKLFRHVAGLRAEDFAGFGVDFAALLMPDAGPARAVMTLRIDGAPQRAVVTRAALMLPGDRRAMIAVQPIQHELSAVELAAQADLVRVLTHEIMNSMTPVVSLAESARGLIERIDPAADPGIADAQLAIATLARRASGIMHFVEAYRAYSRAPTLDRRRFAVAPWAAELARLLAASAVGANVPFSATIDPPDLSIDADPDLLAQVAINLLKNGAEAAAAHRPDPAVALAVDLLPGGRTRLRFRDNGAGIAAALRDDIFLPFFTTKPDGTGVGLSLARRIVIAHGGDLTLAVPDEAGACFEITL
ncbi:sensor histidine kinase [Sphingomonas nostoxanthinifaciens]|uniref:sensor histidine kinase n=1 Tax=Sphingomonas nostoxanthinifaciens TaxID=2872652 RepID=UPI001CC1D3C9|nr:ATP-binding protein [Sphingomonas nostoxanthinifaciens]UAK24699.1 sensor histidine kinase [Sphingomonas nostoxanthinifaciens]